MVYVFALIAICVIGWFLLKPLVGIMALRRNPIAAGQNYIKQSLRKQSSINAGLISDEAYKQLARLAFQIAELSHTVERQTLFGCYIGYLDLYVQQVEIIMSGHGTDLEDPVFKILHKHGVPIPTIADSGKDS
jgi:hypothetical protein